MPAAREKPPSRTVWEGDEKDRVWRPDSGEVPVPAGWTLLPVGDALVTRRLKLATETWTLIRRERRNRTTTLGTLADAMVIERVKSEVAAERSLPANSERLATRRAAAGRRNERYRESFAAAVRKWLSFAPDFAWLAERIADEVAGHTTKVGGGTVGRSRELDLESKVSRAVIAFFRHAATDYDDATGELGGGELRHEARSMANREARDIIAAHRPGGIHSRHCPLCSVE